MWLTFVVFLLSYLNLSPFVFKPFFFCFVLILELPSQIVLSSVSTFLLIISPSTPSSFFKSYILFLFFIINYVFVFLYCLSHSFRWNKNQSPSFHLLSLLSPLLTSLLWTLKRSVLLWVFSCLRSSGWLVSSIYFPWGMDFCLIILTSVIFFFLFLFLSFLFFVSFFSL